MDSETRKEVIVEYPVDVVYDTLLASFPIKYYKLVEYDHVSHSFIVADSFNSTFIMEIDLNKHTPHTTIIYFYADYPHAIADITHGGQQAINTILEELLNRLNEKPRTGSGEVINDSVEVVNRENFVNNTKNQRHTTLILVGYILSFLSIILPLAAIFNMDSGDSTMALIFVMGIVSLSFEINISIILQYYEDSESVRHGRIQLCLCGLSLVIIGIYIHPALILAGILIPAVVLIFLYRRSKSLD